MTDSSLVVEHLTKRFGERVAYGDVSFEVGYGEVFGFLGPNGPGKTTTVRTVGTRHSSRRETKMAATLKLTREGFGIELRRGTFDVLIDGDRVASITWHDTIEVPVESGLHKIRIRKGRYSSRDHSFEAADGGTVAFRVHGAMVWPRWVLSTLKPDLAISLKRQ
jgi:energy-coupling factor transporter ATP-binding protein EcfA2